MNNEKIKNDVKEFNNLKKQIDSLQEEFNGLNSKIAEESTMKEFKEALNTADFFVNNISDFYEELEKQQLYNSDCDYANRKNEHTQAVLKAKKQDLDSGIEEIEYYTKNPTLMSLFLEITLRCNAKCEHCGSSCGYSIPKDEISAEEIKKALLEIREKYKNQTIFISVTGGEPLMRKDLFNIMEYAVSLGYHWGMTSNGMLINKKMIENFRKSNMECISISLDGLKETHEKFRKVPGSFDKIMKSIDLLKELETLKILQVTTVVNKKNISELEDIYKILLDKNIKEWRVMPVDPIGRASQNDEILLDKEGLLEMFHFIHEKRLEGKMNIETGCSHYLGLKYEGILRPHTFMCGAGLFIASILSNGDICVCPNVRRKELIQGNIKTDSFVDTWENKFKEFRKNEIKVNDKCKKCKSFKYCRGDSLHTWNFDEECPNMCMKEILQEEFIE